MKKLILALTLSLIVNGLYAENKKKEIKKKEVASDCCTATLTYNGQYVDHETVCGFITTGDNCQVAKDKLLKRHPEATLTKAE
ncbi:hypothetical protein FIA58_014930 [Flavobacterium jejuense]|uniref:Kazal-like domain-containing protein n=1 Tax=Flavobacterium jejuense TaxID=1544455 RepID=A0ABX0ITV6_9FLAO|nr:hypothetical protein [Flavobacterium jejuense]NHN26976.1 hypothetical protein [Flavobacterium jejuense]